MQDMHNSIYVGIDESNRGKNPEVHCAVFSKPIAEEILLNKFGKSRKNILYLWPSLITKQNHYTFCLPPQGYFHRRESIARGIVLASLIKQDLPENLEELKLFLDGKFHRDARKEIKSIVSDFCEVECSKIELICRKKLDKKCLLVNQADKTAYFIYKKFNIKYACFHQNYRELLE